MLLETNSSWPIVFCFFWEGGGGGLMLIADIHISNFFIKQWLQNSLSIITATIKFIFNIH